MNDVGDVRARFEDLSEEVVKRIPGLAQVWYRPESSDVVDLRLRLVEDSWEAREQAIEKMLQLRREKISTMSINYSFTLPDAAYGSEPAEERSRVHAFA